MPEISNTNWIRDKANLITSRRLGMFLFAIFSAIAAVLLAILPFKMQFALIVVMPAVVVGAIVLKNVYSGILIIYLSEYLRPVDIIPAFGTLRVVMLVELLTLISWFGYLSKTRKGIRWEPFNTVFISFIALLAITVVTALNNRFAYNTTQTMFITFLIFLIATNVVNTPKRLSNLIWILLVIHFYHGIKGIFNSTVLGTSNGIDVTSGNVGSGFIGDENDFALALIVVVPFAFYYFTYAKNVFKKYFSLIIMLVFILGVIASTSRGGFVGLVAVMIYSIIRSKRKWFGFGILVTAAAAVILFAPSRYWEKMQTIDNTEEGTAKTRKLYWMAGVRMMIDNPLTGVGAGNGPVRMPEYVRGFSDSRTQWGRAFHGTIPQVMGELGVFGIGLYLTMLIYAFRILAKIRKLPIADEDETVQVLSSAIPASIIGYLVTSTFLSSAYYPQLWTLYAFTIILKYISEKSGSVTVPATQ